jgi:hypothetical protein
MADCLTSFTPKLIATHLKCISTDIIRYVTIRAAALYRSLLIMLVKVRSLEKNIINLWMMPPRLRLLKNVKVLEDLVLVLNSGLGSTKGIEESSNFLVWPSKRVFNISLSLKASRVLAAEIIFNHSITDDNITQEYVRIGDGAPPHIPTTRASLMPV